MAANFLDISIIKATYKISFDMYRKITTTDIIVPNDSCHSTEQKLAAGKIDVPQHQP
jgi:ABC-type antimicrobial peptide transport system ATPase subunit